MLRQPLERLFSALNRVILPHILIARLSRHKDHPQRKPRLAAFIRKSHHRLKLHHSCASLAATQLVSEPFIRHDLRKHTLVRIVRAVRAMHHLFPHAACPYIHLLNRRRKTLRPKPLHHLFRISPRLPHHLAWSIEQPRQNDLPVGGTLHFSNVSSFFCHFSSPSPVVSSSTRPT